MLILGIDPGSSSGCIIGYNTDLKAYSSISLSNPYPIMVREFEELVRPYKQRNEEIYCIMEKVGAFPGQSVVATWSFAEGNGVIIGLLLTWKIPYDTIAPVTWQKSFLTPKFQEKTDRKKWLQAKALQLMPDQKIILKNADGYLLNYYARQKKNNI